jgi:hypothetical protein
MIKDLLTQLVRWILNNEVKLRLPLSATPVIGTTVRHLTHVQLFVVSRIESERDIWGKPAGTGEFMEAAREYLYDSSRGQFRMLMTSVISDVFK